MGRPPGGRHLWFISISVVPYTLLAQRVVMIPVEDAEELNHVPCTAEAPVAGASRAKYPLGVLMVVLVVRPVKNISPSAGVGPGGAAPVPLVPAPARSTPRPVVPSVLSPV